MKVLSTVEDPELHKSLTDLDMIKSVDIENDNVKIEVTLTIPGCPLKKKIKQDVFQKMLSMNPNSRDGLIGAGAALCRIDEHQTAENLLRQAQVASPEDVSIYFLLIENRLQADDPDGTSTAMDLLLKSFSLEYIKNRLLSPPKDPREVPFDRALLADALAFRLRQEASGIETFKAQEEPSEVDR